MRKSFTRLFGVFMLLSLFCISAVLGANPVFDGANSIPKVDANNVKPADVTSFVVAFDQAITLTASGGTFSIYSGTGLLLKTITIPSASVQLGANGKSLVVNPGMTLTPGKYSLSLTAGSVKSADGGLNAAIAVNDWRFVMGDFVAPKLKAGSNFTPKDDASHLAATTATTFTLVFDEPVAAGTGNIVLYRADGVVVDIKPASAAIYATTGLDNGSATFSFAPTDGYKDMTGYYVKVEAGAIVDNHNELTVNDAPTGTFNYNKFAGVLDNTTYNFSTKDYSAPVIVEKSVSAAGTSATLSVSLNEVGKVKYIVQLASLAAPSAATVLASSTEVNVTAANTIFTANMGSLATDTNYKVYLATTVTYSSADPAYTLNGTTVSDVAFKTSDGAAPTRISALDNSARINNDDKKTVGVKIHYNEEVVAGSGTITVRRSSDDFGYLNIPASSVTVKKISDTDYEVSVPFSTALESDVQYYVVMPQGVVKDKQNNPSAEITQLTGFYINGFDYSVPQVLSVKFSSNPSTLADNIIITFSEELSLDGAINLSNGANIVDNNLFIAFETNNAHVAGVITYAIVSSPPALNKSTITIDPSVLLPNTTYSVRVRPNVFKDNNGNTINTELPYTLTTLDLGTASSAYSVGDMVNTNIAKNAKYKVVFEKLPKVVDGSNTVPATDANLAAITTLQKVASPNVNIPFTLVFGMNNETGKYEAVITPSANLESGITVKFDMDESKLKDSQGTVFGAVSIADQIVEDWNSPTVKMLRSGNIFPAYPAFAIEFNEVMSLNGSPIANGTSLAGYVTVKNGDANGSNVPLTSVIYTTADKHITITPASALEAGKTYYYSIGSSLSDASGNKIAATSASFTVNNTQFVKAISTSPAKGATGVVLTGTTPTELAVSVTFDQVCDLVLGTTDAARTAYLMTVGSTTVSIASHVIVDGDLVGSTLSFKFTGLTEGVFNASNAKWYVNIPGGVIKSSVTSGLLFNGFPVTADAGPNNWPDMYFLAKDIAKPTATYTGPVAAVAMDANLTYTFNEEVGKGSGNILIKTGGATELTIDVNSGSVELAGNGLSVIIKHSALTKYATAYTVEVPVTAFKDKAGNELSAVSTGSFTTVVNPAPTAQFTPAPGADVVQAGANLIIKFSEPVDKVSGKIISLYRKNEAVTPNVWVPVENILSENTVVSGDVVTINPSVDLLANTIYSVQIQTGAYKDKSLPTSADYTGIAAGDYTTWSFSTKNESAPIAAFTFVKRSDDKVATASNIVITFSKPIEKANGSAVNNEDIPSVFSLKKTDVIPNVVLTFTGIISDDKTTVTLNGASYTPALVSMAGYNISVVDLALRGTTNNAVIGATANNATFTISDYTKPVASVPTFSDVADNKMKATMKSDEDGKLYYIFQEGDNATATPSVPTIMAGSSADCTANTGVVKEFTGLTSQKSYVIFVVAEDKLGNVSDVVKAVQATNDVVAPLNTAKTSVFDKTNKTLELTFNEAVTFTGNAVLFDKATMVKVADMPLSAGSDNKKVILTFGGMTLDVKEYYVEVENVNIKDASNNNFAGIYGTSWLVSSADQTAPGVPTVKPTANTGIKLNEVFTLEFNEDVKLVDPMPVSAVVITEGANPFEVVANVTAAGKVVTVDPGRDFKEVTSYTLTILANSFSDLAGNKYNAPVTKTFTTLDATPASVAWSPDGSATVPASTTTALTITFDQVITQLHGTAIEVYDLDSLVTLTTTASAVPAHTKALDFTGKIITISIPGGLKSGTAYTYGFKAKFKGTDGLTIPAQSKTFQTTQSSESITILPADNDTDNTNRIPVPVNQTFSISANLPFFTWSSVAIENNLAVTADYAKAAIKLYPGGTTTGAIDMDAVVSVDGRMISLTPKTNLNSTSDYDLVVLANKLQLGTGNSSALNTANITVKYTTVDVRKPLLDALADGAPFTDGYAPAKGGIVGKSEALKLSFDENVKVGAGMVEIHRQDGVLVKSVDASAITTDNKVATILSSLSDLPVNQNYYVIVPAGAITDNSGNPFDGLLEITSWAFTVKDDVSPQATYTPNNVSGVMLNTDLKLTFDRAVTSNPNTAAPTSWIAVYKADGTAVELIKPPYGSKVTYSAGNTVATIDINTLEQNTTYNVEVGPGVFMSTTNVPFGGILRSAWTFTTEDNTAPKAVEFTPVNKGTIDLWENTLSVKFDKNIAKGTGKIYVRKAPGLGELVQEFDVNSADVKITDDVLSFAVTGLAGNTNYYVIIENTAITNTSTTPENYAGLLTPDAWTFSTTNDEVLPTAEYAPNGPEAIDLVPAEVVLTMTFTEPVVAGLGNLVIYNAADDAVVETIAIVPAMVVDTVVTVTPTKLVEGTSYYVLVDAGVVKDLAENNFAGVANKADWTFATGDLTKPELVTWTPNKVTLADNHPTFVMTFKEDVALGAGNVKVYKVGGTTPVLNLPVTAAMVSGKVVTVDYVANATTGLDKFTDYYVLVDAGAVKDLAGNDFAGVADATAWTFKTGDFKVGVPTISLEFKVYPNPFVDYVNVANASLLSKIVVTNIAGQTVKQVVNPTERIQLNELRSGVYFMSMYDMDNVVKSTAKIVKR